MQHFDETSTPALARTTDGPTDVASGRAKVRTAGVAAFTCAEIQRVGREMGLQLAVIATTSDPERHAARLSATRHAVWSPRTYDEWPLPFDDGLALPRDLVYRQIPFDARWLGAFSLPRGVSLSNGSLAFEIPPGTFATDLSAAVRHGFADRAYDRMARRPAMVRRRHAANRPVVATPLYAQVAPDDYERFAAVDDLFAFRPADLPALAFAVALALEALILSRTMALNSAPRSVAK